MKNAQNTRKTAQTAQNTATAQTAQTRKTAQTAQNTATAQTAQTRKTAQTATQTAQTQTTQMLDFDSIKKKADTLTQSQLDSISKSYLLDKVENLTQHTKILLVTFDELKKAIDDDVYHAVLQADYSATRHNDANSFNLIRFVERKQERNYLTNMYMTVKSDSVYVKMTVTANNIYQDELRKADYNIIKHSKTVKYTDVTTEIKTLLAVYATVQTARKQQTDKQTTDETATA